MSLDKSEQQPLTFRQQREIISLLYLKDEINDESEDDDEDEDEDQDSYADYDEDEDEEEENCIESKAPERHSHHTGARTNGPYDRTSAPTKPQKLSKASEIIIRGIQNKDTKETINKKLMDTYHEGGDLDQIFCSADSNGITALTICVLSDNWEVAECLLQILFWIHQNYEAMHEYVNKTDDEGNTMVHEMAYMGYKSINTLERLLSLRFCNDSHNIEHSELQNPIFDIKKSNNDGEYPLHFSMKSPNFSTKAVQVFYNVDPNILKITDRKDNTILHYFLLYLPQRCSTFHSSQEAAKAVRETLEFLLQFDAARDCMLLCNRNNKTPEILLGEINNISTDARAAATQVLRKQPKPQLLQIPLDQPSTIDSSPIPSMQIQQSPISGNRSQLSPLPVNQNELSTIPALHSQASPMQVMQNQASTIPGMQNQGSPIQAMQNQGSPIQAMQNQGSPIQAMQNQGSPIQAMQNQGSPIPAMQNQGSPIQAMQNQGSTIPAMQNQEATIPGMQMLNHPFPIPAMQSQPPTIYIMENQHLTIPDMENEPSAIPDLQNQGDLLEDKDVPADPDNIQQLLQSFHLESFDGKSLTSVLHPADPDNIQPLLQSFHLEAFDGKSLTSDSDLLKDILKDTDTSN